MILSDEAIQSKAVELKSSDINNVLKIPPSLNFSLGYADARQQMRKVN